MKHLLGVVFILSLLGVWLSACGPFASMKRHSASEMTEEGMSYYQRQDVEPPQDQGPSNIQPKRKILVMAFWNDTPVRHKDLGQDNLGQVAADELQVLLENSERVIVPTELRIGHKTEDYIEGDKVKVASLVQAGRKQGVSLVIIGRINSITLRQKGEEVGVLRKKYSYAAADVEMKLFDVQAGREILAVSRSGEVADSVFAALESAGLEDAHFRAELSASAVRQAVSGFMPEVVKNIEKIIWQGRIARIEGKDIFVNAGRASGLINGDILKVFGGGEDVFDPVTGAYLGRSQGKMKGTLEVYDFIGEDGGVARLHTGGNVQEGDLVEIY